MNILQIPALHSGLTLANQRKDECFLMGHLIRFATEPKRTTNTLLRFYRSRKLTI